MADQVEETRPQYVWNDLEPSLLSDGVPRYVAAVEELQVIVYAPEIGSPRWEIAGYFEDLFVCSLGHSRSLEQAKADGIRAALRLAAKGWRR